MIVSEKQGATREQVYGVLIILTQGGQWRVSAAEDNSTDVSDAVRATLPVRNSACVPVRVCSCLDHLPSGICTSRNVEILSLNDERDCSLHSLS